MMCVVFQTTVTITTFISLRFIPDMSLPESGRNKIAIGASGLVLGVVFAAAGLLYYNRRKTTGGGGE